jgi:hypothetical protein
MITKMFDRLSMRKRKRESDPQLTEKRAILEEENG